MLKILPLFFLLFIPVTLADSFCVPTVIMKTQPQSKQQVVKLSDKINLHMTQVISLQSEEGRRIATNVMCQFLEGAVYTGSEQEWKQYIDSGVKGLVNSGYKNVELSIVGDEQLIFKGEQPSVEYNFSANNGGNVQVIYNVAVLDKTKNRLYSISVSGNELVKQEIYTEFKRVVATLEL